MSIRIATLMLTLLVANTLRLAHEAVAADEAPPPPPPPVPDLDAAAEQSLEPEVTIIQRKGQVIEEYRVNGQLRYVKVIPEKAPPYYLIDMDGDGSLETRAREFDNPPLNQWILLRW